MIMLLGGTTEGGEIAALLRQRGYPFFLTVATGFGKSLYSGHEVIRGRMGEGEMASLMEERGVRLVIDATHPFAIEVSREAMKACEKKGVRYLRYQRPSFRVENATYVSSLEEGGKAASSYQRIFYTAGSKGIGEFLSGLGEGREVVARVIPRVKAIAKLKELGIKEDNIVALQGPFSSDLNRALFSEFGVEVVVAKDSGREGGLEEKAEACQKLGVPLIVVERPRLEYPLQVSSYREMMEKLGSLYRG